MQVDIPRFPGWHLIGSYPEGDPSGVGSWLLHHNGEAMLLEVPECLDVSQVAEAVQRLGVTVRYVTASHEHWDHLDTDAWAELEKAFPEAKFIHPTQVRGDKRLEIGGETVWLVKAPKHSTCDVVTVFQGVAMTGDIETGTLRSVNAEVPLSKKKKSMARLREFEERCGYRVHSTVSAHLNSVRTSVNWASLFEVGEE